MKILFDRYTETAMQVVSLAHDEALERGCDWVNAEHILIGLTGSDGDSSAFLNSKLITIQAVRSEIEQITGQRIVKEHLHLPFSKSTADVLLQAQRLSIRLKHPNITSGHLLWALMQNRASVATTILRKLGGSSEKLQDELYRTILTSTTSDKLTQ